MSFSKVAILGPGLLGGSLALALRARAQAKEIALYCRRAEAAEELKRAGVASSTTTDPAEAVRGADVVVLCVPIGAMEGLSRQICAAVDSSALITDVGSVKAPVVETLEPIFSGRSCWVGSHPMAGSEKAGFSAARADLFEGATTIVTPTARTGAETVGRARAFWESVGSRVLEFSPETHDGLVAQISHLPHLLAAVTRRGWLPVRRTFGRRFCFPTAGQ
jgi:prephenate dehydrogenase